MASIIPQQRASRRYLRRARRPGRARDTEPRLYTGRWKRADGGAAAIAARSPRQSLRLAALVFMQYGLLALDVRFVASANYVGIAMANVAIATTTWYVTRGVIAAQSLADRVCFAAGGAGGAVLAVYMT